MPRPWIALVAALLTFSQSGCATVFNGGRNTVRVVSEPLGAEVWCQGHAVATTPCQVDMGENDAVTLELRKPGYRSTPYMFIRVLNAQWAAADVVATSAVGGLVLMATTSAPPDRPKRGNEYLEEFAGGAVIGILVAVPVLLVDAFTGAWKSRSPSEISATLQPDSLAPSHP